MTRRNSDSTIPPLAIRLCCLVAVAVSLPLLMWNGLVQQMNARAGDILFWTRGPVHSPSVARVVLLAIDDSTLHDYGRRSDIPFLVKRFFGEATAGAPRRVGWKPVLSAC